MKYHPQTHILLRPNLEVLQIGIRAKVIENLVKCFCWTITIFKHCIHTKGFLRDIHTLVAALVVRLDAFMIDMRVYNKYYVYYDKILILIYLYKLLLIFMSDSEDSTVTYTEVSSPFEDLSDIGSPGVDGPPVMPEDPYAYMVAAFQAPPSPDYVPGPEHPPLSVYVPYVPEPVYLMFMPPKDKVLPAEEQPLPTAVSPTADSPGYILESDPEEDPEKDPTDYPIDREDDDNNDDESSGDDEDDDDDVEVDEEEEHPAPSDSIPPPPVHRVIARMFVRAQTPISLPSDTEVARLLAIPTHPPSPLSLWSSPVPQIPSPPLPSILLPASPPLLVSSPPPLASPT
ncbi:hypothetical protein Tco_0543573 [Tanacetum coccineum]